MIVPVDLDNVYDRDLFGSVIRLQFFDMDDNPRHPNEFTSF